MGASTKTYILKLKKQMDKIQSTDPKCVEALKDIHEQQTQIDDLTTELKHLNELFEDINERTKMLMMINENLEQLRNLNKLTKTDYLHYMSNYNPEIQEFRSRYTGLFEKFAMGDINQDALAHCLDTFTLMEQGEITEEQGKEMGYFKFHAV
jgi:DNA repair ATPase RecN